MGLAFRPCSRIFTSPSAKGGISHAEISAVGLVVVPATLILGSLA